MTQGHRSYEVRTFKRNHFLLCYPVSGTIYRDFTDTKAELDLSDIYSMGPHLPDH